MLRHALSFAARRTRLVAGAVLLTLHSLAAAQQIGDLAPQRSFAVISIPNFDELTRAFEASPFGKLWEDPQIKRFVEAYMKDETEELEEFLKAARIETKDLKPPTGQVGLAFFLPEAPKADPTVFRSPHMLAIADLGDSLESWEEALERLIDHGLDEKRITIDDDTYSGVDIRVIKPVYPEVTPAQDEEEDEFVEEGAPGGLAGFIGGTSRNPRNLYIARQGQALLASTDLSALETAIDSLAGKNVEVMSNVESYRSAAAQRGPGELAYGVLMPQPLLDLLTAVWDAQDEGNPRQFMEILGARDIQALSMGLKLNTPEAAAEISVNALVPEKRGVLALFLDKPGPFEPPTFAPADAADVTAFNFDFARLPELVRSAVRTFPEEEQGQTLAFLDQFANIINPTLEAMGPEVHYITTYRHPLSAESEQQTLAIQLRDQDVVINTVNFLLGQAQGMFEPREFEGNTIYSSEFLPVAAGIGFNRLFIGSETGVENAMRMAGRAEGGKLADEPRFRDATRTLTPGGLAYSFTDVEQMIRWRIWSTRNQLAEFEARLNEYDFYTDEDRRRIMQRMRENQPKWIDAIPPAEVFTEYLGNSVSEFHSTPEGLSARTLILRNGR